MEFTFGKETTRYADFEKNNLVISSDVGDVLVPVPVYRKLDGE